MNKHLVEDGTLEYESERMYFGWQISASFVKPSSGGVSAGW